MTLSRSDIATGLRAEMAEFEALLRSLSAEQWTAPVRCDGWDVSSVAGHVVGGISAVVGGRLDEFTKPGHVERQIAERAGRSPKEVADEYAEHTAALGALLGALDDAGFAAPLGGVAPTLGAGIETLWYDTYVHGDDIRAAIGVPSERGAGVRAAVSHLTWVLSEQQWGPASVELDGLEPFVVTGSGRDERQITGDPVSFVLAAAGRLDPGAIGLDPTVNVYRDR